MICSAQENSEWFRATIGGLGLTGLIEWVEVQLKAISDSWIDSETIRYGRLDEFYALNEESIAKYENDVEWVDTLSPKRLGAGIFFRGIHIPDRYVRELTKIAFVTVPCVFAISAFNTLSIRAFKTAFYWARPARKAAVEPMLPFFYPLDSLGHYHRLYGPGGMVQWQGLIPDKTAVREVLKASADVGGSFLTVMKVMGDSPSAGLLSFSRSRHHHVPSIFRTAREFSRSFRAWMRSSPKVGGRLYASQGRPYVGREFSQVLSAMAGTFAVYRSPLQFVVLAACDGRRMFHFAVLHVALHQDRDPSGSAPSSFASSASAIPRIRLPCLRHS